MGTGIMPELREPYCCEAPCAHTDCAQLRRVVGSRCITCGKPVNGGDVFYGWAEYKDGRPSDLEHAYCAYGRTEAQHAATP